MLSFFLVADICALKRKTFSAAILSLSILSISPTVLGQPFVIGKVSDNPKKHYGYLKPMADYLASNLREFGYSSGKVLMAKNNSQMIRYLKRNKVDLVTETIFSSVIFQQKAGAELLLRKWKKGQRDYKTIIFARKDSGINSYQDFIGKTIAFEDPGSTSAFYVPAAMLLKQGIGLEALDSVRDKPGNGNLGYVFSHEEINTSTWVHKKLVDIGALNDHDWNKADHLPKHFRQDFKIIAESPVIPRGLELVRGGMDSGLKNRIKTLLLNIHTTDEGEFILDRYQKTTKFEDIDDDKEIGIAIDYALEVIALIDSELGR